MAYTFFILAGEASGDLHASKLMQAIRRVEPTVRFVGMGGKAMAAAGLDVAKNLDGMQVVGFWEVAKHYNFFVSVGDQLLDRLKQERPDALICIDYPGFNLRFAEKVKKLGIPVLYYIVPQVWAWKPKRAKKMARIVDQAFCVFDFEPPFFEQYGLKTTFVGHPLVDHKYVVPPRLEFPSDRKTVALLPGSRSGEFNEHIRPLCEGFNLAAAKLQNLRGVLSLPKGITAGTTITADAQKFELSYAPPKQLPETRIAITGAGEPELRALAAVNETPVGHASLLPGAADFSVVKSGTSTLEAGLAGNPLCVLYRGSWASYAIAHQLVNIPVFSLVNIVLGRYAVPELLQEDVNPARIAAEIERGLTDEKYREQQRAALAELPKKLGGPGASDRAACGIMDFIKGRRG